jgi:hypothetical protein
VSLTLSDLNAVNVEIAQAIRMICTSPPTGTQLANLVSAIRARAVFTDHRGVGCYTAISIYVAALRECHDGGNTLVSPWNEIYPA